jgi:hypothetical protein
MAVFKARQHIQEEIDPNALGVQTNWRTKLKIAKGLALALMLTLIMFGVYHSLRSHSARASADTSVPPSTSPTK